jgi:hypothetical protein
MRKTKRRRKIRRIIKSRKRGVERSGRRRWWRRRWWWWFAWRCHNNDGFSLNRHRTRVCSLKCKRWNQGRYSTAPGLRFLGPHSGWRSFCAGTPLYHGLQALLGPVGRLQSWRLAMILWCLSRRAVGIGFRFRIGAILRMGSERGEGKRRWKKSGSKGLTRSHIGLI